MNKEDMMIPTSSPSNEDRQPAEVEESKHLDAEAFWRAYPLMFGQSPVNVTA